MWWPLIGPRVVISFTTNKPHVIRQIVHTSANPTPAMCHTALPREHPYGLYSQHIFFCLFDDLNRTRYLSHPTSVWTQMSCVGFMTTRPTHLFDLKQFWALWILRKIWSPGSHLPIGKLLDLQKTIFSLSKDECIVPSPFQPQSNLALLGFVPLRPTRRYSTFPRFEVLILLSRIVSSCSFVRYSRENHL